MGRRSLDSLRVGVVVLDGDDVPVLVNPAARAMGLLRAGGEPGHDRRAPDRPHARRPGPAHRAYGARWSSTCRAVARWPASRSACTCGRSALGGDLRRGRGRRRDRGAPASPGSGATSWPTSATSSRPRSARCSCSPRRCSTRPTRRATADPAEDGGAAFAERIQHESTRLGRLVNELLELSRLQGAEPLPDAGAGRRRLGRRRGDRPHPHGGRGQATSRWSSPATRGLTVYGSDSQLVTAVANLVENAIAYSRGATPR